MQKSTRLLYLVPVLAIVAIGIALAVIFSRAGDEGAGGASSGGDRPITIRLHCGAGLMSPVQEIIDHFQRRTGIRVEANFGAPNLLLGQIKLTREGDVFLPGDRFYIDEARREGLVEDADTFAYFVPVIMVQKGNPLGIAEIADLTRDGVRLGVADERAAAIGRITPQIFMINNVPPEDVRKATAFTSVTGPELGQAVALGHIDAAIIWLPVAIQYPRQSDIIEIPRENNIVSPLAAAIHTNSKHKDAAREFVEFLTGSFASEIFLKYQYELVE